MGGILVDEYHRTNKRFLYAAGECACQYHGASRLGENSLLGALYGGKTAALAAMEDWETCRTDARYGEAMKTFPEMEDSPETGRIQGISYDRVQSRIGEILWNCLGIVRTKEDLEKGGKELEKIGIKKTIKDYGIDEKYFLETLDEMSEQAFNDQCTAANPRYPLIKEIKEIYLKCYYGK